MAMAWRRSRTSSSRYWYTDCSNGRRRSRRQQRSSSKWVDTSSVDEERGRERERVCVCVCVCVCVWFEEKRVFLSRVVEETGGDLPKKYPSACCCCLSSAVLFIMARSEYGRDEATDCLCCLCAQTGQVAIVESCGKFDYIATPGFHCINCFCCQFYSGTVSLRLSQMNVSVETKTKDNVFVVIKVSVQYEVLPDKVQDFYYRLANPRQSMEAYVFDVVRLITFSKKNDQIS